MCSGQTTTGEGQWASAHSLLLSALSGHLQALGIFLGQALFWHLLLFCGCHVGLSSEHCQNLFLDATMISISEPKKLVMCGVTSSNLVLY